MSLQTPFRILELNVISAQDLPPVSKLLRTYVSARVHPDHKLTTHIDRHGHTNPTWNHKMAFRVDNRFLASNSSAITLEIYNVAWLRDLPVGTAFVPIGQLFTPPAQKLKSMTTRSFSLHIRRPSGHLQGTLNVVVNLLDETAKSMPLGGHYRLSPDNQNQLQRQDEKAMQIIQRWRSEKTTKDYEDFWPMHDGTSISVGSRPWGREQTTKASIKKNEHLRYVVRKPFPMEVAADPNNGSDSDDFSEAVLGGDQWKREGDESDDGASKKCKLVRWKQAEDDEIPMRVDNNGGDAEKRGRWRKSSGGLLKWLEHNFNCGWNDGKKHKNRRRINGEDERSDAN